MSSPSVVFEKNKNARPDPAVTVRIADEAKHLAYESGMLMMEEETEDEAEDESSHVPFLFPYAGGEYFYEPDCYAQYYATIEGILLNRMLRNEQFPQTLPKSTVCVTVTGTPGIGKSVFYAYFCDRFLHEHDSYVPHALSSG
ncbi:hypothetical protein PI124_g18711 [Phytophthora idaei]|nr:hypothetical protein PI125_g22673 [Phytophthora idaei]KAG3129662.1 hypothetical protein PI126_g20861 [Phytophthora idaei]KAG3236279.1 hypothetical protein PI124_g18711 [Phytophthora idaei]